MLKRSANPLTIWISGFFLFLSAQIHAGNPWQFTESALSMGIDTEYALPTDSEPDEVFFSGGAAVGDIDNDGWLDLYLLGGKLNTNMLLRNNNGVFVDISSGSGLDFIEARTGPTFSDMDGDGLLDLITSQAGNGKPRLFKNMGQGQFQEQINTTIFPQTLAGATSGFADIDSDGDLDLFLAQWNSSLASLLWRNDGNFQFSDISASAFGDFHFDLRSTFTPNFTDLNNDGWIDIALSSDFGRSQILINQQDNTFDKITDETVITDEHGMGSSTGDYDNDGDMDFFVTSIHYDGPLNPGTGITGNRLYQNQGDGTFVDVTEVAGVRAGYWGWGSCFADFNNDGWQDIYHVNGWRKAGDVEFGNTPARMFINNQDGTFTEHSATLGVDDYSEGRGVTCFDYDKDGDLDILTANNSGAYQLFQNNLSQMNTNNAHWLNVNLKSNGTNSHGVGAVIQVITDEMTMTRDIQNSGNYLSANVLQAHFGLSSHSRAIQIIIKWPYGQITRLYGVTSNQFLTIDDDIITAGGFE